MFSELASISDSTHRWLPAFPAIRVGGGGPDLAIFSSIAISNIDDLKLAMFEFNCLVIGRAARIRYCHVRPLLHHLPGGGPTPAVRVHGAVVERPAAAKRGADAASTDRAPQGRAENAKSERRLSKLLLLLGRG